MTSKEFLTDKPNPVGIFTGEFKRVGNSLIFQVKAFKSLPKAGCLLYTKQPDQSARISELEEELEQYRNPKNWTRSHDYKGDLIAEHALFRPKLKTEK